MTLLGITLSTEISISDIISLVLGAAGLCGLFLAYGQLRLSRQANHGNARSTRAKFVLDLNQWFIADKEEKSFFYRLDYSSHESSFRFDEKKFPHSEDEIYLDTLLYKLSHVGTLLRNKAISAEDLEWAKFFVRATLENAEVQSYLEWLKKPDQVPDHSGFSDAIYLYEKLFGKEIKEHPALSKYLEAQ